MFDSRHFARTTLLNRSNNNIATLRTTLEYWMIIVFPLADAEEALFFISTSTLCCLQEVLCLQEVNQVNAPAYCLQKKEDTYLQKKLVGIYHPRIKISMVELERI